MVRTVLVARSVAAVMAACVVSLAQAQSSAPSMSAAGHAERDKAASAPASGKRPAAAAQPDKSASMPSLRLRTQPKGADERAGERPPERPQADAPAR
jgi:hypothetical protein